jgi:hypothetical protein
LSKRVGTFDEGVTGFYETMREFLEKLDQVIGDPGREGEGEGEGEREREGEGERVGLVVTNV